ncbi:TPA: DUF551 domain-containing protein [Enterobacter hormaechei subsp. steigerwaltii]|nr:DUF551 domain-containing protein [Enterobacter hormaechei subsp. steigerwaltii]HCM9566182.1 DUF551 domain-containing protein [Enterobacter hormaechei subsp. steigerwaltii]
MSATLKEWLLKTIAELEEERDSVPGAVNEDALMALAAMKIALASLEAEAVAYVDPFAFHNFIVYRAGETYNKRMGREWMWANPDAGLIPVYTAPPATPAPVSVPDENGLLPCPCCGGRAEFDYDDDNLNWISCNVCGISTDTAYHTDVDARDRLRNVWNLRTAMLQGAEPVTTANKLSFEQWLSQQTGTIDVECGCVMTEVFFHWLRVAYEAGNSPALQDGWVACSERMPEQFVEVLVCTEDGSRYVAALNQSMNWDDGDFFDDIQYVTHWMPLPAAPQQEVK